MTDIIRVILWTVLIFLGLIGCFLPILPGPLLTYASLFVLQMGTDRPFSLQFLIIWFIITVVVTTFDYIIPVLGTKKMWGTKRGTRGATLGLIVGIIILPILGITLGPFGLVGILGGPFVWAYIGEKLHGKAHPLKSALGSFLGFLAGTFLKLVVSIIMAISFYKESLHIIKDLF